MKGIHLNPSGTYGVEIRITWPKGHPQHGRSQSLNLVAPDLKHAASVHDLLALFRAHNASHNKPGWAPVYHYDQSLYDSLLPGLNACKSKVAVKGHIQQLLADGTLTKLLEQVEPPSAEEAAEVAAWGDGRGSKAKGAAAGGVRIRKHKRSSGEQDAWEEAEGEEGPEEEGAAEAEAVAGNGGVEAQQQQEQQQPGAEGKRRRRRRKGTDFTPKKRRKASAGLVGKHGTPAAALEAEVSDPEEEEEQQDEEQAAGGARGRKRQRLQQRRRRRQPTARPATGAGAAGDKSPYVHVVRTGLRWCAQVAVARTHLQGAYKDGLPDGIDRANLRVSVRTPDEAACAADLCLLWRATAFGWEPKQQRFNFGYQQFAGEGTLVQRITACKTFEAISKLLKALREENTIARLTQAAGGSTAPELVQSRRDRTAAGAGSAPTGRVPGRRQPQGEPGGVTAVLACQEEIVGQRISVYWPLEGQWYAGVVQSYNPRSQQHNILYDDGDMQKLDTRTEQFKLLPSKGLQQGRGAAAGADAAEQALIAAAQEAAGRAARREEEESGPLSAGRPPDPVSGRRGAAVQALYRAVEHILRRAGGLQEREVVGFLSRWLHLPDCWQLQHDVLQEFERRHQPHLVREWVLSSLEASL